MALKTPAQRIPNYVRDPEAHEGTSSILGLLLAAFVLGLAYLRSVAR